MTDQRKDASASAKASNAAMAQMLNRSDEQSFADASKGFIATWDSLTIIDAEGRQIGK